MKSYYQVIDSVDGIVNVGAPCLCVCRKDIHGRHGAKYYQMWIPVSEKTYGRLGCGTMDKWSERIYGIMGQVRKHAKSFHFTGPSSMERWALRQGRGEK